MSGWSGQPFERSPNDVPAVYGVRSCDSSAVDRAEALEEGDCPAPGQASLFDLSRVETQFRSFGLPSHRSATAGQRSTATATADGQDGGQQRGTTKGDNKGGTTKG